LKPDVTTLVPSGVPSLRQSVAASLPFGPASYVKK
jgi:hypothetical protein